MMGKSRQILVLLFSLCLIVCPGVAFMEQPDDLLSFCRDRMDIETCATANLDTSRSLYDIFDTMTTNVSNLQEMCENRTILHCIGPCILEFAASSYSYLQHVCTYVTWIEWEEECWTEQWTLEARQCYRWLYPHHRTENPHLGLYPIPYRVYDRALIARDCFPTSSLQLADKCSFYQTWIFQNLLPHYFQLHGYPDNFNHVSDNIGFPGI